MKKPHHHVATRLDDARYDALERIRAKRGLRSLNATVADLIDEADDELRQERERAAVAGDDR
jgi:hypothetical protein